MNRQRRWMAVVLVALLAAGGARANNLQIMNVTVTGRSATTAFVQFDISWENSWRDTNINHDAAWVFFKVQVDGETAWQHVTLEGAGTNPRGYDTGSGTPIEMIVPDDRVGMFVRRSGEGAGTTDVQNVKAVWNFATNGIESTNSVKLQAFGVEMVYVAEGDFAAGSGGSETHRFTLTTINTADTSVAPTGSGSKGGAGGGYPTGQTPPDNASWPNGYAAFYCMKYMITEGQYADFLNTLTSTQASRQHRGGLGSWPNYSSGRPDRACNGLSWARGAAFSWWAGLRPMTELEYEKAGRGPRMPVPNEYPWGTTVAVRQTGHSGALNGTETATPADANCNFGGTLGPVRVGIYATGSNCIVAAGASYWGIMQLSGNILDRTVTIGHATGREFKGVHGNGELLDNGDADDTEWVPNRGHGAGFRGTDYTSSGTYGRVSDRRYFHDVNDPRWEHFNGMRSVRSAPSGVGP